MTPAWKEKELALDRIVAALRATGALPQADAIAAFTATVADELNRVVELSAKIAARVADDGHSPSWKDACQEAAGAIRHCFQKAADEKGVS